MLRGREADSPCQGFLQRPVHILAQWGACPGLGYLLLRSAGGGNQAASIGSHQGSYLKDKTRDKDPLPEHLSPILSSVASSSGNSSHTSAF